MAKKHMDALQEEERCWLRDAVISEASGHSKKMSFLFPVPIPEAWNINTSVAFPQNIF